MPRKSSKATPSVVGAYLYSDNPFNGARVGSDEWRAFLATGATFYFDGDVSYTARCEPRRNGFFWYAYRHTAQSGLSKRYIGRSEDMTLERLKAVSHKLERLT